VLQAIAWKTHTHVFQVQTWLPGLLFYALGHWFSQRGRAAAVQGWLHGPRVWLLPLGLAMALALAPLNGGCTLMPMKVCADFRGQFGVMFAIGRYGFLPAFLVSALLGIALTVASALVISRLPWAAANRGLAFVGQRTLELLVLNGFVLVFLEPVLTRAFQIQSTPAETLAWALGLVAGQLAVLPLWRRLVEPLFSACRWAADHLLALIGTLRSL
jgi:acyltransferase